MTMDTNYSSNPINGGQKTCNKEIRIENIKI